MTTRGLGHRRLSSENAYYHAIPQSPLAPNPVVLSESLTGSLVLDPENAGDVVEETVMAVEVTPAIRWVHFVFGCAALLPWNGMSSRPDTPQPLRPTNPPDSHDHRDTLFPLPTRRITTTTHLPILHVSDVHRIQFRVPGPCNRNSETGTVR